MKIIGLVLLLIAIAQLFGSVQGHTDFMFPDELEAMMEQRNNFKSRSNIVAPTKPESEEESEETSTVNLEQRSFLDSGCKTGYAYVMGKCRKIKRSG